MRVLVAYGSKRGGTAGLAVMVGDALTALGVEVDVKPASVVRRLDGYGAVVVGGALYTGRWHKDARRFVRSHVRELAGVPAFFFSSGPLDDSATTTDIPPVRQVQALMAKVGGAEHQTFGGRLEPDAHGMLARAMAKNSSGDWRDAEHVRSWVRTVVAPALGVSGSPAPA